MDRKSSDGSYRTAICAACNDRSTFSILEDMPWEGMEASTAGNSDITFYDTVPSGEARDNFHFTDL